MDSQAQGAENKLQEERKALPIYAHRDEFLKEVNDFQVLIVAGETGSGKTTQIPQYLRESGYCKIGCSQPRRLAAVTAASRVCKEMGVRLGHEVGYSIRFEDCTSTKTAVKYMTDGALLREFLSEPDLRSYNVIMVDEAHERTLSTVVLFGLVKDLARARPDLKLIISGSDLDTEKFSCYFNSAPVFHVPGRRYPVEKLHAVEPVVEYLNSAVATALDIHTSEPPGDVLVLLAAEEEIKIVEESLRQGLEEFGDGVAELIICPVYANLPMEKISEPTPEGARKVVLTTGIAETSLTMDRIKYVVDSGICNPRNGVELSVEPVSKASADRRAPMSAQTGPGKCFRLYTESYYHLVMEEVKIVPEIQRTNLAIVVLTLKRLGIHDPASFDFMDAPPREALSEAVELLSALNALNELGGLTRTGDMMAEFHLDPMLSKMIITSEKYECSEEIICIAAMLSVGNSICYDNAPLGFHLGGTGDHIALLEVYNSWKGANYSSQWCDGNFIQVRSMRQARDIRDQLEGQLEKVGIRLSSNPDDTAAIRKAIASGFFTHCARLQKDGTYRTVKNPQTAHIHPSSGLAGAPPPTWVVYHELVLTTKAYMRQVTALEPEWQLEIAPHYYHVKDIEDLAPNPGLKED